MFFYIDIFHFPTAVGIEGHLLLAKVQSEIIQQHQYDLFTRQHFKNNEEITIYHNHCYHFTPSPRRYSGADCKESDKYK